VREARIEEFKGQEQEHEEQLRRVNDELNAQLAENRSLRDEVERRDSEDQRLQEALDNLGAQHWKRQQELDSLAVELVIAQRANRKLQEQLKRRSSENELLSQKLRGEPAPKLEAVADIGQYRDSHQNSRTKKGDRAEKLAKEAWDQGDFGQRVTRALVAIDGEKEIKYPLYKSEITIGRSSENDIDIRRPTISRRHARVFLKGSGSYIEDLDSKNGVYVNSVKVGTRALRDGDIVTIGESNFRFVDMRNQSKHVGEDRSE
jgi:hypothetical protein